MSSEKNKSFDVKWQTSTPHLENLGLSSFNINWKNLNHHFSDIFVCSDFSHRKTINAITTITKVIKNPKIFLFSNKFSPSFFIVSESQKPDHDNKSCNYITFSIYFLSKSFCSLLLLVEVELKRLEGDIFYVPDFLVVGFNIESRKFSIFPMKTQKFCPHKSSRKLRRNFFHFFMLIQICMRYGRIF